MTKEHRKNKLVNILIALYLALAFGGYFISLFITRLTRIKSLFGL